MTDTAACCPPPDLGPAITAFRRHAFTALLTGQTPSIAATAEKASRDAPAIAQAITWLEAHGQLERDGDVLIGGHGLTHRTTPHTLTIDNRTLHTWCAYDAIAIPTALRATALATTTCPTCHRDLTVLVHDGHTHDTTMVLWLPTGPCHDTIADFCSHANLYCNPRHLRTWHQTAGHPPGRTIPLTDIPGLACSDWADIAAQQP